MEIFLPITNLLIFLSVFSEIIGGVFYVQSQKNVIVHIKSI